MIVVASQAMLLVNLLLNFAFFRAPAALGAVFFLTRGILQPAAYLGLTMLGVPVFAPAQLALFLGAGVSWLNSAHRHELNPIAGLYVIFLLVIGLSYLANIGESQDSSLFVKLSSPLAAYIIYYYGVKTIEDSVFALNLIVLTSLIPVITSIYQFFMGGGYSLVAEEFVDGSRVTGTIIDPNLFGIYLSIILYICIFAIYTAKKKRLAWVYTIVVLAVIVLSKNRGTWLALAVSVLATVTIFRHRVDLKKWIAGAVVVAICSAPIVIARFSQLGEYNQYGISEDTFSERLIHWQQIFDISLTSPIVGVGLGNASIPLPFDNSRVVMPHNDYVRTAAEFGYVGLLAYLGFLIAQLVHCARRARSTLWPIYFCGTGLQIYIIIISISQNVFGDILNYSLYMAFLAVTHRISRVEEDVNAQIRSLRRLRTPTHKDQIR